MYSHAFAIEPRAGALHALPVSRAPGPNDDIAPKIIVIDAARHLIEATAGARAMLAEGRVLRRCFDQLAAATRADAALLATALSRALHRGQAHVSFEGDGEPLEAEFVAIQADRSDEAGSRIVVILKPALEQRQQRLCAAEARFSLTRAETRLLAALFEGCSVPQAADRLGVARSTARTHLQRVFDKTGARRQGDLLRLVACA